MKTWLTGDTSHEYAAIIVAETRGKAKVFFMGLVGAGDWEYTNFTAWRFPELDYLADGVASTTEFDCAENVAAFIKAGRCKDCWMFGGDCDYTRGMKAEEG